LVHCTYIVCGVVQYEILKPGLCPDQLCSGRSEVWFSRRCCAAQFSFSLK